MADNLTPPFTGTGEAGVPVRAKDLSGTGAGPFVQLVGLVDEATGNTDVGSAITTAIAATNTALATTNSELTTVNTSVGATTTAVNAVETELTTVNASVGAVTTAVNAVETELTTVNTSVGAVTTAVNAAEAELVVVNTSITATNTALGTVNSELTTINTSVGAVTTELGVVNTSIGATTTAVNAVETELTTVNTSVGAVTTAVTAVGAKLPTALTPAGGLQVGGKTGNPTSTLTRPANTTAYTQNNAIASNTAAGSVVVPSFTASPAANGTGRITGARLVTNASSGWGSVAVLVEFWTAAPTLSNGDGGAYAIATGAAHWLGSVSLTFTQVGDGAYAAAVPNAGGVIDFALPSGTVIFWTMTIISGAGATPISGQTFTLTPSILED